MKERITTDQFRELTRPLLDLPVSGTRRHYRTRQGYDPVISFELGELREQIRTRKDGSLFKVMTGESAIRIDWSWRVERARSVFFGSSSGTRKITNNLSTLHGQTVTDITTEGRLPELVVQLSGGLWIHSFCTLPTQPGWMLALDGWGATGLRRFVLSSKGRLYLHTFDSE